MSESEHIASDCNNDVATDVNNDGAQVQINDPYIDLDSVIEEIEEENRRLENIELHVGKEFKSMEEAYDFYNLYALVKGFSIRWNQKGKSKKGVTHLNIVCSKQGLSKRQKNQGKPVGCSTKVKTPEKVRSSTRTWCKAYMRAKLVNEAIWEVTVFKDEHNHDLAPNSSSKNRILRSHRSLTMEDRDTIKNLSDQNIGPSKILEYLSVLHGGKDNVHFRRKDVSNVITTDNRKLFGKDVDSTLLHFQRKQDSDPEFFYAIDADEDGFVKHIFWADGRSRRAYLEFGDVVTFDTTYNTNKYSMPLAPFIGVNHHRQSIFFGMALLRSENAANFCWLFETWLKAMYGKHPKAIITDQDPAMKKAINIVFPNTVHMSCQWHVMRKAREQLGSLYGKKPTFAEELGWVINGSLTVSEFENAWAAMIDKHKVQSNKHLNNMFKKRVDWAPAYFRGVFFAEMTTSQRSESMNALFKLWVNAHTSIYKFVCSIDHIIENIWANEGDEDLLSMNENPQLWSKFPFELDAREVYTRKVYSVFKQLLQDSCLGIAEERERGTLYEVKIDKNPDFKHWRPVSYLVKVDKEAMLFSCNCNGFEFQGLLCPHAMKVMWILGMQQLPSHYILKRWCRNANVGVKRPVSERSRDAGNSLALQMFRATTLKKQFSHLVDLASKDVNYFNTMDAKLRELVSLFETSESNEVVNEVVENGVDTIVMVDDVQDAVTKGSPLLLDPPISQCKGKRKRPERWKTPLEKAPIKGRTCGYCGLVNKHNIRTCPKKIKDESKGKKEKGMKQIGIEELDDETEDDEEELDTGDDEEETNRE